MVKRLQLFFLAAAIAGFGIAAAPAAEAPPAPVLFISDTPTDVARYAWVSEDGRNALAGLIEQHKSGQLLAYAFAAAPGGNFWASRVAVKQGDFYSMEDLARMSLESCEHYRGSACFLVSMNGRDATDSAGGLVIQPSFLANQPSTFDPDRVPFARTEERHLIRTYTKETKPRAFVVSPSAGWSWRAGNNIFEAINGALADCQKNFPNQDCLLYAVNEKVVF
jgi:hypothetical protein